MTSVQDILNLIQTFAPLETAEDWDNVGLLVGRRDKEVRKVLVALDPFLHVIREAEAWGADASSIVGGDDTSSPASCSLCSSVNNNALRTPYAERGDET